MAVKQSSYFWRGKRRIKDAWSEEGRHCDEKPGKAAKCSAKKQYLSYRTGISATSEVKALIIQHTKDETR